jgi:dihydroorotate dehydrogenase (fumarate)
MSPDNVHKRMVNAMSFWQRVPGFKSLVRAVFKQPVSRVLKQEYYSLTFNSPVGLSAGFDKNGEIVPVIASLGFGFGEVGSVTAYPCDGNPRPWFYRLSKTRSLVVNAGLSNQGSEPIIKRLASYSKEVAKDFPVILSIAKTNSQDVVSVSQGIDDYVTSATRAKNQPNIKMIELNISCPNAYGGEDFTKPGELELLLTAIGSLDLNQPIFIKMPINLDWAKTKELLDVIVKHNMVGVTIGNLAKDRTNVDLKDELPTSVAGNLSGKPTWDLSNKLIRRSYLEYGEKLTIIGVGGIFSADDAYTKIRLGASLVELITGMIFEGPQLPSQIADGLLKRLKADGFDHISQAIGIDAGKSDL